MVIPAFKAAQTIEETLRALQACDRLAEIGGVFLLDDASPDDTSTRATNCWKSETPLFVERNERNLGERRTVNTAFARLRDRFDWIFILHADDVVKPLWLNLYLQRIKTAGTEIASICSSYDCWYADIGRIDAGEDDPKRAVEPIGGTREAVLGTLRDGCRWHVSGCAIRTDAFLDIGEFRPEMPQLGDYEWLLRCLKKGYSVEYIPRTTMLYRMHAQSISSNAFRSGQDLKERLAIFRQYHNEGYIDRRKWLSVRAGIIYSAAKRIVKQVARGRVSDARRLASVYGEVARSR